MRENEPYIKKNERIWSINHKIAQRFGTLLKVNKTVDSQGNQIVQLTQPKRDSAMIELHGSLIHREHFPFIDLSDHITVPDSFGYRGVWKTIDPHGVRGHPLDGVYSDFFPLLQEAINPKSNKTATKTDYLIRRGFRGIEVEYCEYPLIYTFDNLKFWITDHTSKTMTLYLEEKGEWRTEGPYNLQNIDRRSLF